MCRCKWILRCVCYCLLAYQGSIEFLHIHNRKDILRKTASQLALKEVKGLYRSFRQTTYFAS
jgi:hypothetical protein